MHVLWNNHRDVRHPSAGGAERTIHEVGRRLVKRGHEVTVLTSRWKGGCPVEMIDGIRIVRFPGKLSPHFALPAVASEAGTESVVVDDLAHVVPWFSPFLTPHPGTVFFRHLHARTLEGQVSPSMARLLVAIERQYGRLYRHWPFVAESKSSLEDLVTLGVSRERIVRIPPGVNTSVFSPREKTSLPSIVYFGGFREYKRPHHAILVHRALLRRGVKNKLTMIGSGPSLSATRDAVTGFGLQASVEFTGKVSTDVLSRLVGEAWVNIHCSLSEGWGYSILEADACGTPTVAYSVRGVSEAVLHEQTGLLVPDGSIDALTDAVAQVLQEGTSYMGRRCVIHAKSFDWDTTAKSWESHLHGLRGAEVG